MSLWSELRRRNVIKVAVAYAVIAWLVIEVAVAVLPTFAAPAWAAQTVIFVLILGFPLAVGLAWAFTVTPDGIIRTEPPVTVSASPQVSALSQPMTTAAAVLPAPLPNSIAVLPFTNISPNPADAFFAVGIHEEILNQLAKIKALSVIARTSVLKHANSQKSIPEIAGELNVATVMEGSVRYAGKRVRVTTQLIQAASGMHMWSETYDREFEDIFAIESDIALQVANALRAEFSIEEKRNIERRPTESVEAYAIYLQALGVVATSMEAGKLHELFDKAIALDPDFALAYANKAAIYADTLVNTIEAVAAEPGARAEIEALARRNALRALELDPSLDDARATLAHISVVTWRWSEALDIYRKMGDFNGKIVFSTSRYIWLLAYIGDPDQGVAEARRSLALNPGEWFRHFGLGTAYGYARRYAEAIASLKTAIELAPAFPLAHSWLAYMEICSGNHQRALAELALVERFMGQHRTLVFLPELAFSYGRIGRKDDARRLFDEIGSHAGQLHVGDGTWATAYLAIDDQDKALEHLEKVAVKARNQEIEQGFFTVMNLKMNIWADPRLASPRFRNVLDRIDGLD